MIFILASQTFMPLTDSGNKIRNLKKKTFYSLKTNSSTLYENIHIKKSYSFKTEVLAHFIKKSFFLFTKAKIPKTFLIFT